MKNLFGILLLTLFVLLSCQTTTNNEKSSREEGLETPAKEEIQKLLVLITTLDHMDGKEDKTTVIETFAGDYFEMSLTKFLEPRKGFKAQQELEKKVTTKGFYSVFTEIVDNVLDFKSTTDFLNYMSKHGYDMVSASEESSYTKYTFKKK